MTFADIKNKIYFLTSTNSSSFTDSQITVEVGAAADRITALIMQSDGRWQWDDENLTDLPIATTALVASQQDYTLAVAHLQIVRVEIQDQTGNWTKLMPIDSADVYGGAMENFPVIGAGSSATGLPQYYDKIGNSFFLYPAPNYSQAASLKIWFKRGPLKFDYTTGKFTDASGSTASSPGFNSLYHELMVLWPAYNFALANGKSNAAGIYAQIQIKEDALHDDYSTRDKDDRIRLAARPMRWR